MTDLVSILMPAYQAQSHICDAVSSVLRQSEENWELIIIADDQFEYKPLIESTVKIDDRVRFCSTEKVQSGPNHARNIGLSLAQGNWIAPLDADDIYYPSRLHRLLALAKAHSGLALDNINLMGADIEQHQNPVIRDVIDGPFTFNEFKKSLVPLLFLFHRELIRSGWDEDVIRGADTLFNLRALECAGSAAYEPVPLHEYRVHNQSMCHAEGAEQLFERAYQHTLQRLREDGLGFTSAVFKREVVSLIEEKQKLNQEFNQAIVNGYAGNYQEYVHSLDLAYW